MEHPQAQSENQIQFVQLFNYISGSLIKGLQYRICKQTTAQHIISYLTNSADTFGQNSEQAIDVISQKKTVFDDMKQEQMVDQQQSLMNIKNQEYINIENTSRALLFSRLAKKQEAEYLQRHQKFKQQYGLANRLFQMHQSNRQAQQKQTLKMSRSSVHSSRERIQISLNNQCKISLIGQDIQKLQQNTDLNDTIIEAYLKIMKIYILDKAILPNIFLYSTYFLSKLIGEPISNERLDSLKCPFGTRQLVEQRVKNNYGSVKRWTKGEDIFTKQILVFPINFLNHWNCIFVLKPSSLLSDNCNECEIIYCDSMFQCRELLIQFIRSYLRYEIEHKKGKYIDVTSETVPSYQLLLPRQPNLHDCGLYMLLYIEQHLANHKRELCSLKRIKNRHKLHLFPFKLIMTMRYRLMSLFLQLSKSTSCQSSQATIMHYLAQKSEILDGEDLQYDTIDEGEYGKYLILSNFKRMQASSCPSARQQSEFGLKIRFYLDPQINFYIKMGLE